MNITIHPNRWFMWTIAIIIIVGIGLIGYINIVSEEIGASPVIIFYQNPKPSNNIADWKTYRNEEYGFEVKFPTKLNKKFITLQSGPTIEFINAKSQQICKQTDKRLTINHLNYCITIKEEGAAGHIYTAYTYLTEQSVKENQHLQLSITLRYPVSCTLYEDSSNTVEKCQKELNSFNANHLINQILSTFKFIPLSSEAGQVEPTGS